MARHLRLAGALALAALCALGHAAAPVKEWRGVLPEDPPGFDPAGPTSVSAANVLELVFDRLLTYDYLARPAKLVPLAAEALPVESDAGRTWTIRLRKGIHFSHDPAFKGVRRELTAQDFVYSFERFLDPAQRSPYQFLFRNKFVGLDELARKAEQTRRFDYDARVEGLEAVDRYTLRFRLRAPDHRFPYLLAHSAAVGVAREVVEAYKDTIRLHPVGTGPYVLTAWTPGTRAVLDANPEYRGFVWDFEPGNDPRDQALVAEMRGKKMPQIGHIELFIIEEDTAYWLAFLKGDLYAANLLPRFQPTALVDGTLKPELRDKGLQMYRDSIPATGFSAFNFRDSVVGGFTPEKIALRRAIALAFNGEDLVHVVFNDNAARAQMLIPPAVWGHDPAYRSRNAYDPDLANRLLDRFGYQRGADGARRLPDGRPLELVRNTGSGGTFRDIDKIWQASMERIGLRIRMTNMTGSEAAKASTTCTTMIFDWNWFADYPDGENFMQLLYGPNSNQANVGCYRSATYDRLYERSTALPDGPERAHLFLEMTRQAEVDGAAVLGAWQNRIVMLQPFVQGHKSHPFLFSVIPYVDVKPH
jgi:ABC-type transport system substrate-binding protein